MEPASQPNFHPPRDFTRPDPSLSTMMLITVEDPSLETLPEINAVDDALRRAANTWAQAVIVSSPEEGGALRRKIAGMQTDRHRLCCCRSHGSKIRSVTTDALRDGMLLAEYLRGWDPRAWPFCDRGLPSADKLLIQRKISGTSLLMVNMGAELPFKEIFARREKRVCNKSLRHMYLRLARSELLQCVGGIVTGGFTEKIVKTQFGVPRKEGVGDESDPWLNGHSHIVLFLYWMFSSRQRSPQTCRRRQKSS